MPGPRLMEPLCFLVTIRMEFRSTIVVVPRCGDVLSRFQAIGFLTKTAAAAKTGSMHFPLKTLLCCDHGI
jgi:hypothetical protein